MGHSQRRLRGGPHDPGTADLVKSCIPVDTNTLAPGMGRNQIVFANAPEPRLTRESQRWVFERYSCSGAHITDDWLDAAVEIAQLPKYQETVKRW